MSMIEIDPFDRDAIEAEKKRDDVPGPWVTGPVECINCGFRAVACIAVSSTEYNAAEGFIDMLECTRCGKYTMCSE